MNAAEAQKAIQDMRRFADSLMQVRNSLATLGHCIIDNKCIDEKSVADETKFIAAFQKLQERLTKKKITPVEFVVQRRRLQEQHEARLIEYYKSRAHVETHKCMVSTCQAQIKDVLTAMSDTFTRCHAWTPDARTLLRQMKTDPKHITVGKTYRLSNILQEQLKAKLESQTHSKSDKCTNPKQQSKKTMH